MNKTDLLFQMMERPQAYTDHQWQDILSDEECRELYTLMAKTRSAFDVQKEIADETIDAEWKRLTATSCRRWFRMAAMFIGILMITGIAYAAYRAWGIGNIEPAIQESVKTERLQSTETKSNIVRFDNVQLDSVLQVVAQYYNKMIVYRDDSVRYHRMLIEWNQAEPLASFILLINNFDGIHITETNDSLIVE
jgi:hypothetical protein